MFDSWQGKEVVVTGGTGMIGRELVKALHAKGASIMIVTLDEPPYEDMPLGVKYYQADLRNPLQANSCIQGADYLFHLAGIKGSPLTAEMYPARFMVPMLQLNTNMMEAAFNHRIEKGTADTKLRWMLFTSSMGVYAPADEFFEDEMWSILNPYPSPKDWFAGWTKRVGELQVDAYKREGWTNTSVVRPANVYGKWDNFDLNTCMAIPAIIRKVLESTGEVELFGDGSNVRDFVHARDVAEGMVFAVENEIREPLNLASGTGHTIKEIVETVVKLSGREVTLRWLGGISGDERRLLSIERLRSHGLRPKVKLEEGLAEVIEWYKTHQNFRRYNAFTG